MIVRIILLLIFFQVNYINGIDNSNLIKDTRIKKYEYNVNEIYLLELTYGYQSQIELERNEIIQTISIGDTYSWRITPLKNRIFINPMEKYARTNMTVITNKRSYQFDLVVKDFDEKTINNLVYVLNFTYPMKKNLNIDQ